MRAVVRHGINGNEVLTTQVVAGVTVGWDLMEQMARKLRLPLSDCSLLEQHGGDALSGANHQFSDDASRLRGMLSCVKIAIPNRRALPDAHDCVI